jgi:hypothetical protein
MRIRAAASCIWRRSVIVELGILTLLADGGVLTVFVVEG